ncbi:MAG: ATP-dependent DNA helicase Rep [Desulfuromonas sp.]|uniref:ATP-dependent helicase n=1 Tax=Desulfuromonas sp. TaxID=892 RepID=UPI000CAA892C|nr:UvrD-helicase domain-containing protein [Desulfuromonas sp.]PLX83807.1 MAG: ATP-dependent DNA helicase Rep [Desulfuromonas sp.]
MDLNLLNPQQRAAVCHCEGPLLVFAGAGSGKTRVITCRIGYLLRHHGVEAGRILAVTFTNKAAREMHERVKEEVGRRAVKGMVISTFHSLCVRILKEEIERLGYKKNFSIYGTADQVRLIRDILQELGKDGQRGDAERVLWLISDAKNRLQGPGDFSSAGGGADQPLAAETYARYQKALKAYNALDFDDLLMLAVRLFREHPEVLTKYQERFRYIMVDEYQDTNAAQYELLCLLAEGHRNLCVVGDDDQSIYGWRGAEPENILKFEGDFPGTTVVKLEQNYRSTGNILAAANAVIRKNKKRKEKALWTAGGEGRCIEYLRCDDEEDEARTVVERIHAERFRNDLACRDFAILYRTNTQSRAFEEQLRYENVPYVLIGGQQFFDRKEVKDALAYLRVLVNSRDEVNLLRILNYPRRGIGETTADRLIRHSSEAETPLWEVLRNPSAVEDLGAKPCEAIVAFVELMERYRRRFSRTPSLAVAARDLFGEIRLEDEIFRGAEDPTRARRRLDNLEEVVNALASFEEREGSPTLEGFLGKVSLLDDEGPGRGDKDSKLAQDAVTLMSLHSSKGLEFPVVFLAGMEEGFLPHRKSIEETFDIDEERRLCYVGITRARRHLLLLNAAQRKKYGKPHPRVPSRFMEEIPAELLDEQGSTARPPASEEEQEEQANSFFSGIKALLGD